MAATTMPAELGDAIAELEAAFPGRVSWEAQAAGDVVVVIADIELGPGWSTSTATLIFGLPYHYPDAAIYPYYVRGAVHPLGGALQQVQWRGEMVTQVSLRHSGWDPSVDTALGSVLSTLAWLRQS